MIKHWLLFDWFGLFNKSISFDCKSHVQVPLTCLFVSPGRPQKRPLKKFTPQPPKCDNYIPSVEFFLENLKYNYAITKEINKFYWFIQFYINQQTDTTRLHSMRLLSQKVCECSDIVLYFLCGLLMLISLFCDCEIAVYLLHAAVFTFTHFLSVVSNGVFFSHFPVFVKWSILRCI